MNQLPYITRCGVWCLIPRNAMHLPARVSPLTAMAVPFIHNHNHVFTHLARTQITSSATSKTPLDS